jgi:uncharacterized membrane protein YhiD involved in acid resistance
LLFRNAVAVENMADRESMSELLHSPASRLVFMVFGLILLWAIGFWVSTALRPSPVAPSSPVAERQAEPEPSAVKPGEVARSSNGAADDSFVARIFGPEPPSDRSTNDSWFRRMFRIIARLGLAAVLSSALAFRSRKNNRILQKNPYVAQSQILLAVVASALMMIVADSAARAFGIFAAASLVRFRTNIRDPKEITVLLLSLGIGLATGVGKWELAIILSLFVLLLLALLEHYEISQVFRAMELKVKSRDVDEAEKLLARILKKHSVPAEVRELERQDESDPIGKIVYYVNLNTEVSTERLSEEILSAGSQNIESVEWHQKKSSEYVYR